MNNKILSEDKIYDILDKEFTILENNYRYNYGKKIPYDEQFEIFKDIYKLINSVEYNYISVQKVGILSIKRYIPLLDLIVKLDDNKERLLEYDKHLKNAYKLCARISLEHYMVYREWEIPYKDKFFEPRYEIMKGYIHYLQEIIKNGKFEVLISNMSSGWGKTYPEKIAEAWSFGYDDTGTILSLCSNDRTVTAGSALVKQEIKSEIFGEVFPHMKYSKDDKKYFLKETDEAWKLKNCKLGYSYLAQTTQSNTIGGRASKLIHIDDLYADYKEAMNENLNEYYYNKFQTTWKTRFVQNKIPKIIITGTLWASGDFIAKIIELYKKQYTFIQHPKYKYVWINIDDVSKLGQETIAIIQVPALNEYGESSCPELKSTSDLLKVKNSVPEYLWETNFQQKPTDPEALIFSYDKIRTYDKLPQTEYDCYAYIDGTRKSGKDNFSMPIFQKRENGNLFEYHLKDCLFTKVATSAMYDDIIKKIIEHHIIKVVLESNTATELKRNLEDRLKEKGINWCQIEENYEFSNKTARIVDNSYMIQTILIFPQKGLFGINSPMGKFMNNLTTYNSKGNNENDDAPDSCSGFIDTIVKDKFKPQKAKPMMRIC